MSMASMKPPMGNGTVDLINENTEKLEYIILMQGKIMDLAICGYMPVKRYMTLRKLFKSDNDENRQFAAKVINEQHKKHFT